MLPGPKTNPILSFEICTSFETGYLDQSLDEFAELINGDKKNQQ